MNATFLSRRGLLFRLLVKGIFFILSFTSAVAQTDTIQKYDLQEVVVTATRSEKQVFEIPRSVTVIPGSDIRGGIYHHAGDVLAQEAGIFITGAGQTPGTLQNLYLRGANTNHTIVMIDGVRITDPSTTNNSIDLSELSMMDIERIEIVRGAHSTLYGSSAIGGVINILTRRPEKSGIHGMAALRGGLFGAGASQFGQALSMNYSAGSGFYANADLKNTRVNGLDASIDTSSTSLPPDRDDFDKIAVSGKAGFRNDKWDLFASYKKVKQRADIDDGPFLDDDNYVLDFRRDLLLYGASYKAGKTLEMSYRGGWTDLRRTSVDDSSRVDRQGNFDHSFSENVYDGKVLSNELQATYRLSDLTLTGGAGRYDEKMSARSYFYNSAWNFETTTNLDSLGLGSHTNNLFLHLDISGGVLDETMEKARLTLGGRWNAHSAFGTYFTYEIAPSLQLNNRTLLYANIATGFNAPSLYQLYTPESNYLSGIRRGNPDLQPEKSVSYELGWKQRIGNHTSFRFSFFQTRVSDIIEYVYLWDAGIPIDSLGNDWMRDDFRGDTYLNIGNQTNRGLEFSLESHLSPHFTVTGNVSLVEGMLQYEPGDVESGTTQGHRVQLFANGAFLDREVTADELPRRSNTANLRLAYRHGDRLSAALQLRHAGPRNDILYDASLGPFGALNTTRVNGYTLLDLHASYRFSASFSAVLRLENLLNENYREVRGYRSRGRGIFLSTQLNW